MRTDWPLVGRQAQQAAIHAALTHSGGAVLTGAAGVGKSRLARQCMAHSGYRATRWIAATDTGRTVPLAALAEYAGGCGPDPLRRVEEMHDALVGGEPSASVLVCVDDAHHLDEQSALVIDRLIARRIATVLMTVRDGEATAAPLAKTGLPRIEIGPLTSDEVTTLLEQVLDGPLESASAQRFWSYTRGNALYLRQLVDDESSCRRLTRRAGVWIWDASPGLSPPLTELIEANIGHFDGSVVDVLDVVAVCEPLELSVLGALTDATDVHTAAQAGLITVDERASMVHLAHPLFGEVRRDRAGNARLRAVRTRVAEALGRLTDPSPVQWVRRGMLMMDSDGPHDPRLLTASAEAALQLLDPKLSARLAAAAMQAGGGRDTRFIEAMATALAGHGHAADQMLAELADAADGEELGQIAFLRAANLAWSLSQLSTAEAVLDGAKDAARACGLGPSYDALRGSCLAARGQPREALPVVTQALSHDGLHPMAQMFGHWGQVCGFGDVGRLDELSAAAEAGYRLASTAPEASHLRFAMGLMHIVGLRLAGETAGGHSVSRRLRAEARDVMASQSMTACAMGLSELACGALNSAAKWFRDAIATGAEFHDSSGSVTEVSGLWLATALAMAGEPDAARQAFDTAPQWLPAEFAYWECNRALAQAWVEAAEGLINQAVRTVRQAARSAQTKGRPAHEVLCLQTAAQFGDATRVGRLDELAAIVDGPRASAAAIHARGLHRGDASLLMMACDRYRGFGDRAAAADAAAQAAVAAEKRGEHRVAGVAATRAAELADECGARTPAYRAMGSSTPLTPRQREVLMLAATGLSNRQIADRLVMSVRTVEGHLTRAARRTGATSRDQLIALLHARRPNWVPSNAE
jgi:DNA-binding CsgD family transcriptional regulator